MWRRRVESAANCDPSAQISEPPFQAETEGSGKSAGTSPVADARAAVRIRAAKADRETGRIAGKPVRLLAAATANASIAGEDWALRSAPRPCGILSCYWCGFTAIHRDDRSPSREGSYPCPYGPSTSCAGEGSSSVVRVVRRRFPVHIARQATIWVPGRSGICHWRLLPDASMPGRRREWCAPTWPCIRCRLAPSDRWTCGRIGTEACRCFSILRVDRSRRAPQQDIQPSADRRQVI